MSEVQLILIIFGAAFAFWQIVLVTMGLIMMSRATSGKVAIHWWLGWIAVSCFIAAVLL